MITPQVERPKRKRNNILLLIVLMVITGIIIGAGITATIAVKTLDSYQYKIQYMTNDLNSTMAIVQEQDERIQELQKENDRLLVENTKMQEKVNRVLTISDVDELARVVQAESNTSLQGQMAVVQTILDRSILWKKSSGEVVSNGYTHPYKGEISDRTVLAIKLVYDDGIRVYSEPTTHFYAYNICDPSWADYKVERGRIDGHRFMY